MRLLYIICIVCGLLGCDSGNTSISSLSTLNGNAKDSIIMYSWEKERVEVLNSTDMVLIYGGGHQRNPYSWDQERIKAYVTYMDMEQNLYWLFDSFLFLEIMDKNPDGVNKMFASGYGIESANQTDWSNLIDYYFQSESGIGALDNCIQEETSILGKPEKKRQIIVGIPEPIIHENPAQISSSTTYWGNIGDKLLNFSITDDRIRACEWYIDKVRAKFNQMKYKNIELAGFYWIAEEATNSRSILENIASYLNKLKYSFNWIPYYGADGYSQWQNFGFNNAYLQPNYFFDSSLPYSRLTDACQKAIKYNMDMELEFDNNALNSNGKAYRLVDYLDAYKQYGIWVNKSLAYYQGSAALFALKNSTDANDQDLYHKLCEFIISRPIRLSQ